MLFFASDLGPCRNGSLTVKNNWLNGSDFILFCVDGNNGQHFAKNISILSNRSRPDLNCGPLRVSAPGQSPRAATSWT